MEHKRPGVEGGVDLRITQRCEVFSSDFEKE